MSKILFDTFTDPRDGEIYPTVKIGNQVWLAENLRYSCADSYAYDNDEENVKMYGRLYTYKAALIACPAGWHLPSDEDWDNLINAIGRKNGADKLKSKAGWNCDGNGTDEFGFAALPGGFRYSDGNFFHVGYDGLWWSATAYSASYARLRRMGCGLSGALENWCSKSNGLSVRCVKD